MFSSSSLFINFKNKFVFIFRQYIC